MTTIARHAASPGGPGIFGRWVQRHGWRAYALPVLAVITAAALLHLPAERHRAAASSPVSAVAAPPALISAPTSSAELTSTPPPPAAPVAPLVRVIATELDSTECLDNTASTFVLVSISQQHAWMCQAHEQVESTAVTTGDVSAGDATPTGSWVLQGKQTNRYLTGPGYRDYVNYWLPFDGDIGFHDATWQTMPFGSPGYTAQGSHGCVHLPLTVMAWLYSWAKAGSTVVTVEH